MYKLTCPHCKKSFTAINPDKIYCCETCRKLANKKKNRKPTQKTDSPTRLAVLDFETDPFKFGREVSPFAYGLLLESGEYYTAWNTDKEVNNDLIQHLLDKIDAIADSHIIYAHNGGRFDFFFLLDKIYGAIPSYHEDAKGFFLIHNRITRIAYKQHELRDSYSIMPVPLKTSGNKIELDYALMEKSKRNKNRTVIDEYLKQDCVALLDMVKQYRNVFAKNGKMPLTMASAAFKELKAHHDFKPLSRAIDSVFREFYAGGHTQCYEAGIVYAPENDRICLFDVNSEYPSVMKYVRHPVGNVWTQGKTITENTFFVEWSGTNHGAVYAREKNGSIDFTATEGRFKTTIHEYNLALKLGLIEVDEIHVTWDCAESITFAEFVDEFFKRRLDSAAAGDEILVLFWKLVLNSAYGKFGQNADNFGNYLIVEKGSNDYIQLMMDDNFASSIDIETAINGKYYTIIKTRLTEEELDKQAIYNVATAASITGAARALLMQGLYTCNVVDKAKVLYVDTDSMFTYGYPESLEVVKDKTLGKWNFEAQGVVMALAGKKQYALFDRKADDVLQSPALIAAYPKHKWAGESLENFACRYKAKDYKPSKGFAWIPDQNGGMSYWSCCKLATKGTRLAPQEVVNMAYDMDYSAKYDNFAPTFDLHGGQRFISRLTRNTAKEPFTLGKRKIFIPTITKSLKREYEIAEFH